PNDEIRMTNEDTAEWTIGHSCVIIRHLRRTTDSLKGNTMNRRPRRPRGFTLMEILLVLAILVVLASMVTLGYSQIQKRSYVNAAKTQIGLLEDAVKTYQIDVGSLPQTLESLLTVPPDLTNPTKWGGPYLGK